MNDRAKTKITILEKIKEYETIIIHRHSLPDGDSLGSAFGLKDIIKQSFPEKRVYAVGSDEVEYLRFLGKQDEISDSLYENALVIILDTSTAKRINGEAYKLGKEIIKIDHHIETDPYGDINYVLPDVASTTLVITDLLLTFPEELKISAEGAKALYLGTVTDTGRFKYRTVNGYSLKLAGHLLDYGFNTEEMYEKLYIKKTNVLRLQGYLLRNFKITPNGVNYIYLSRRIQKRFNVNVTETSSLVNAFDNILGSLVWILFVQDDKGLIRGRLRSRYMSINELASEFGGGGHAQASGVKFRDKKIMKVLINRADELVKEYKANNKGWI